MIYIAQCSFGKDSTAMVLRLIEEHKPLDQVIFFNTGMEFQAVYDIRDKILPILEANNIKYIELKPEKDFLYYMTEKEATSKQKGTHKGWGTRLKIDITNKYLHTLKDKDIIEYVGIAADESNRVKDKIYPLIEWDMTEKDCLKYCNDRGFYWIEENNINLYDILDRVSCWCCCNKNRKELKAMYQYLPSYWKKLEDIQLKLERPMKEYKTKKYGAYGNVLDMGRVFEQELSQKK